ncbi:MAG: histidinol phosphatase [Oscillospiraceae bacterium]|nr:histidinol phosphatase [Oscillospiraceae bacterium]
MFRYETHLHTAPVSKCARADVRQTVEFYKAIGHAGIFITNHFLDGNINIERSRPYAEKIDFYFSDFEQAVPIGQELGLQVFCGVEMSHRGSDFLVYGPDKQWYLDHPELMDMKKSQQLTLLNEAGALLIQAHPFREASYIDHIRLFPRHVHGVEICNTCRTDFENEMARHYADSYGLLHFAGSDNHTASKQTKLAGMEAVTPLTDEWDFVRRVKAGEMHLFQITQDT